MPRTILGSIDISSIMQFQSKVLSLGSLAILSQLLVGVSAAPIADYM